MPVWHDLTKSWVQEKKLVLLGITQEQHPERCRLFAQWKQLDWPILHDPINVLESTAVPILLAIDEHGIVRSTRPNPKTFEKEFLNQTFADDATNKPESLTPTHPPAWEEYRKQLTKAPTAQIWRRYGDALTLWGDLPLADAIAAYQKAIQLDPNDGAAWFRMGVCFRRRSETKARESGDFRMAIEAWSKALELDPNQYIWRRRIQQYGPRLDKPYPFYDWVTEAETVIRKRGETPVQLPIRPNGAEIAQPAKSFVVVKEDSKNPDPEGKINRDQGSVLCEVVTVPATGKSAQAFRVHLTFRLNPKATDHWNDEAEPLRIWIDPPEGVQVNQRLLEAKASASSSSTEDRSVGFELQIPKQAQGTLRIPVYALYHLCDDQGGQCRFLRQDMAVKLQVP